MRRPIATTILLLTSLGAGVASSPICRNLAVEPIRHAYHSAATLLAWKRDELLHPERAKLRDVAARRKRLVVAQLAASPIKCEDLTLLDATEDVMLQQPEPSLDVPIEFASQPVGQLGMDDTAAAPDSNVEIAEAAAADNPSWHGGSPGWGPILLGGGSAPPTIPPVAPIPEPATISLLAAGIAVKMICNLLREK